MPITLHIIRASEFIRVDTTERMDFEASKNVLRAMALACRKRGLENAMLDVRAVPVSARPQFTDSELAALVGAFHEAGFSRRQRLAVLYRRDAHGRIRTFTFLSKLHGLHVEAFHDFENALQWLSEGQDDLVEQRRGAPVPLLKREAKKRIEVSDGETHGAVPVHRAHRKSKETQPTKIMK